MAAQTTSGGGTRQVVLTSTAVLAPNDRPDSHTIRGLARLSAHQTSVCVISNHALPGWFAPHEADLTFLSIPARQDGHAVRVIADHFGVQPHQIIVLGASRDDLAMAKNGGATFVAAGWLAGSDAAAYGIRVADVAELDRAVGILAEWAGGWWYSWRGRYSIHALTDLSGYNQADAQQRFGKRVTAIVKQGGAELPALLALCSRSLFASDFHLAQKGMWGVYPSSAVCEPDGEVLSDFTHRLRTTVARAQFAKRGNPLFVRHQEAPKRSRGAGDRLDPSAQLASIHLNPFYRGKVAGRTVVVVDDCLTYGLSFGVAEALLRGAGAADVRCVALGKFGNTAHEFEIQVTADPFRPMPPNSFELRRRHTIACEPDRMAQSGLRSLLLGCD